MSSEFDFTEFVMKFPATVALVGLVSISYIIEVLVCFDIFSPCPTVLVLFAEINSAVLQGQIWRLVTAIFIHASIIHYGSNALFLLLYSLRLEELKGHKIVFVAFFLTGIVGNLVTLIWGPNFVSLGASGAVFGLLGTTVWILQTRYPRQRNAIIFSAFFFFMLTISADTNIVAHLGGLLSGLLLGWASEKYKLLE